MRNITGKQSGSHRHHFFGGPGRGRPFHRGDFKYIILRQIRDKPSYGYEIIRALEERFHSFYVPSPGSVYPTLQMLEEMGHAVSTEEEGKKVFTITDEGLAFLEEQKDSEERIKNRMESWGNPENIEEIREMMREFEKLAGLIRNQARDADSKRLGRMKKAIAKAYQEISKEPF